MDVPRATEPRIESLLETDHTFDELGRQRQLGSGLRPPVNKLTLWAPGK